MEPGHYHLQLIMSVALILTAAVVAFICDVLKRNNEQLREMNIELKLRQEQDQRSRVPERVERPLKSEKIAPPAPPAPPKERSALGKEKKRTVNAEALAAMERGAALAGTGGRPRALAVAPTPEPQPQTLVISQQEIVKPEPVAVAVEPVLAKPVVAEPVESKPAGNRKDWGSLLSRNAQGIKPTPPPAAPVVNDLPAGFQAGFHDGHVLSKLVQSHQPVTGLVVSIGVNASQKGDRKLPESVSKLVESLLGPDDFAAQSGEDEFLLIYPRERGASAQRRLSQIAQQLWDFQLRSLGSFQILFSWGGVEVRSESIEEAIASASERMQETKRGRKLLTMESPVKAEPLRKAV
jgi:hypothetical protein